MGQKYLLRQKLNFITKKENFGLSLEFSSHENISNVNNKSKNDDVFLEIIFLEN